MFQLELPLIPQNADDIKPCRFINSVLFDIVVRRTNHAPHTVLPDKIPGIAPVGGGAGFYLHKNDKPSLLRYDINFVTGKRPVSRHDAVTSLCEISYRGIFAFSAQRVVFGHLLFDKSVCKLHKAQIYAVFFILAKLFCFVRENALIRNNIIITFARAVAKKCMKTNRFKLQAKIKPRTKKAVFMLSEAEYDLIGFYLKKYKITNRSRWFRETVLNHVLKNMEQDYPTLFEENEMRR